VIYKGIKHMHIADFLLADFYYNQESGTRNSEQLSIMETGEIILYQSNDKSTQLEVRIEEETVWLTQAQMVELFSSTKQNISLHINNIYKEGELSSNSTVKEYLTVQIEGSRKVQRKITRYNLDVIISVGYRVKLKKSWLNTTRNLIC
jgi:hypothetical protein